MPERFRLTQITLWRIVVTPFPISRTQMPPKTYHHHSHLYIGIGMVMIGEKAVPV